MSRQCKCGHAENAHTTGSGCVATYGDDNWTCGCLAFTDDFTVLVANLRALGCSDGYCYIAGRAKGMHTNGGCQCPRDPMRMRKALALLRKAAGLDE